MTRLAGLIELDGVELVMAEVDVEDAIPIKTWPQGHVLIYQSPAYPYDAPPDADAPAIEHSAHDVVGPVLDFRQATGHRARAGAVAVCGYVHADRLVRAFEVVDV